MRWLRFAPVVGAGAIVLAGCGTSGSGNGVIAAGEDGGGYSLDGTVPVFFEDGGSQSNDGASGCTPRTCAQAGANCGQVADGCGGLTVDCGTCAAGESCGGGKTPNVCGGAVACVPKTCADPSVATLCGEQPDGCGGVIPTACVTCTGQQTCGGGGTSNQCGGSAGCIPATTCPLSTGGIPMNCGVVADGCGGVVTCGTGAACPAGESCGGAPNQPNVCGSSSMIPLDDGGIETIDAGVPTSCVPATSCPAGINCGPWSDGCGGSIASCGTCSGGNTCGGGGTASVCGQPACTKIPITTACTGAGGVPLCGAASDGCGGTYTCPTTCTSPQSCGGGGTASECGQATCTAITACPTGVNCGPWPDGCGGIVACGNCTPPASCGGANVPSQCGVPPTTVCDAGLKCDLSECDGGAPTVLKGQIFDPAGNNPLYNIVVYVPNSTPSGLTHGQPSCASCSTLYTGDPIVSTTTDTDGHFVLTGVPVPTTGDVPIVIQIGKWRRQWVWPGVKQCQTNTATTGTGGEETFLRLPGSESTATPSPTTTNDDLPQIGISTGSADTMECLFERIGFAPSEYVCGWNGGTGHLHIFQGGGGKGGNTLKGCAASSPTSLWDLDSDIYNYDIVVLSCEGAETTDAVPSVLHDFAQYGGRAFGSHFHYSWFSGPLDSNQTYTVPSDWGTNLGTWTGNSNPIENEPGKNGSNQLNADVVETISDGGTPLKTWLGNVSALGTSGAPKGELYIDQPRFNVQVTAANTPSQVWIVPDTPDAGPDAGDAGYVYEYGGTASSANEYFLPPNSTQYFSFDTPIGGTAAAGIDAGTPYCGRIVYSDLHVGSAAGDYSKTLGNNVPSGCNDVALSPQEKALEYMLMDLSSCVGSDTNLPTPPSSCVPLAACPSNYVCGYYPDGCGGSISCGNCSNGSCVAGKCATCAPATVCPAAITCGEAPDGCGGSLTCGSCPSPDICVNGACSTGCVPATTCPAGINCGPTGDGCGGTISCGTCPAGTTCGGGGSPGVCGVGDASACVPQACPANIQCGPTGNGCGGIVSCGTCPTGETCGGGGTAGVCGAPSCTPGTCASLHANCGEVADGCGGLTANCGTCTGNQTCAGGGTANMCGAPACTASTCTSLGVNCGPVGDGCGNVLQCGTCTAPDTCGGGGTANVCGTNGVK